MAKINPLVREFEAHVGALVNVLKKVKDLSPEDMIRFEKKVLPVMERFNKTIEEIQYGKETQ